MARAWTLALAVAMLMTGGAEAGFTKTGKITGNARKRLENGTVYTVAQDELSVKGSSGWSGLYLDANSTAVLYIPAGMTLKVTGGSASDRTGAGAGIEIPPSSTLIVTGGGTLEAYGGKGEDGDDGGPGGDGQVIDDDDDPNDEYGKAGKGGSGGAGGGGGGAGIGGNGGTGGASQTEPETSWVDTDGSYDYRGYNGYSGLGGGEGGG
ncbi:MAG: hypothetical protein IKO64_04200, partial [Kiritimatiellae bacterium]|nr:hypothetical protein [Kiritimatiellia bacterium]